MRLRSNTMSHTNDGSWKLCTSNIDSHSCSSIKSVHYIFEGEKKGSIRNPLQSPNWQRTTSFQYILLDIICSIHSRRRKKGGEEKSTPITCSANNDFFVLHERTQEERKNPLQSPVRQRMTSLHYMNGFKEGGKIHSNHTFS
jgi:hypothetical protein